MCQRSLNRMSYAERAADLGRMSAEAVLTQYKAAADAFAAMGDEIKTRVERLQGALNECDADMNLLAEGAKAIMEKGKRAALLVEEHSQMSRDLRAGVAELMKKIGA